jgi:uncharacterized protein YyaL (SSP411 family)
MTGNTDFEEKAAKLAKAFSSEIAAAPSLNTMFLVALDFLIGHSLEIVIASDLASQDSKDTLSILRAEFIPNKIVLFKSIDDLDIVQLADFVKDMKMMNNKTTCYICSNFACSAPVTDKNVLRTILRKK